MAQKDQKIVFERSPLVDFVLGPGRLDVLVETIEQLLHEKPRPKKTICVSLHRAQNRLEADQAADDALAQTSSGAGRKYAAPGISDRLPYSHTEVLESFRLYNPDRQVQKVQEGASPSLVRIMFGCDQFCSYCVVPFVRGPEQSRSPQDIVNEVKRLADQGVTAITLIGQTVSSYRYQQTSLSDLLSQLSDIAAIEQIDFVTNYPLSMRDDLLQAVRDLPKVSKHLHVPAQSGSDAVLARMNRHYTAAQYREMTDRIYATIPGATMTSDFIVGFCGETDEDFEQTVALVKYCRFRNSFIFKYSERPGTKAAELYTDDVPEEVKKHRNNRLLEVQIEISRQLAGAGVSSEWRV